MADDWDLNAIVRSCSSVAAAQPDNSAASCSNSNNPHRENNPLSGLTFDDEPDPFAFPDLTVQPEDKSYSYNNFPDLLQDSYKPFLSPPAAAGQRSVLIPPPPNNTSNSNFGAPSQPRTTASTVSPRVVNPKTHHQQQQQPRQPQDLGGRHRNQRQQSTIITLGPPSSVVVHPALRTAATLPSQQPAARKNNQKRLVVQVTADNLSNDVWAWRKYGQKPIKGSPYPRNYYRCSSSKGCAARKQVERSTTDPNMFIISYAGDHTHPKPTHRNSLAGSTRTKFPAAKAGAAEGKESEAAAQPAPPPTAKEKATSAVAVSLSPTTPPSATMDHDNNNNKNAAVAEMMPTNADIDDVDGLPEFESGEDDANVDDFDNICDDDDDDDDSILIPNNNSNVDEDIFMKGWKELGGEGAAFGDNFSSWIYGSTSAAGGGGGG
ncbi:unnamed protein product [Linum tenue]|uniref:WRKY domain-containing protein n=1 Tax=Linum tenue TaxID=586396 RepID=A0AAV0QLQ4_9ROSI|nr:unnamed protein product [Linum tenue]